MALSARWSGAVYPFGHSQYLPLWTVSIMVPITGSGLACICRLFVGDFKSRRKSARAISGTK
jgi:hypothetical protein